MRQVLKNRQDTSSDLFAYVAIVVESDKEPLIRRQIRNLKHSYFGRSNVEPKSRWFRLSEERERYYLKPYNLTLLEFTNFSDELFRAGRWKAEQDRWVVRVLLNLGWLVPHGEDYVSEDADGVRRAME